jgi:phenylacetate-coenzyme A ligase PaaK-like adenylate-forming protein
VREAELMARDHWTREELLALQRNRLQALITYAVTHSSDYREALGADAANRPLAELPALPKSTMMAEFDVPERLRQALLAAIRSTGAVPPTVGVEPIPALKPEPSGKIRLVRSA